MPPTQNNAKMNNYQPANKEHQMQCECKSCGMGVKGLCCAKCDAELVSDAVRNDKGEEIKVAKCPNGCGMIKSPSCCGRDMQCS